MKRLLAASFVSMCLAACSASGPAAPQSVALDGAPNGVAVQQPDDTLYVTDDASNAILASSGGARFGTWATIPDAPGARHSLSQIAVGPNGELFVERFGFGKSSAIFRIDAAGRVTLVSDVHPERRRLGLVALNGTQLLSSWFEKEGDEPAHGGVSLVSIDPSTNQATERDVVAGLGKPVGIAVSGDTLFISDQTNDRIVRTPLRAALSAATPVAAADVFARVTAPDLLAVSPDGSLYGKCGAHALCRFSSTGNAVVIADDFDEPRGVAVDVARQRVIAVDRARGAGHPSRLRFLPMN